jgi:hypothetical protein
LPWLSSHGEDHACSQEAATTEVQKDTDFIAPAAGSRKLPTTLVFFQKKLMKI